MKKTITLLLALVLLLALAAPALAADGYVDAKVTGTFCYSYARQQLAMVNDFRTGSDAWYWNNDDTSKTAFAPGELGTLQLDAKLEQIAMERARELALVFNHYRPDETNCFTLTVDGYQSWGENIAYGFTTSESVFTAWREDDQNYSGQGHRRNMLTDNYVAAGFGCFYHQGVYYWVQEYSYYDSGERPTAKDDAEVTGYVRYSTSFLGENFWSDAGNCKTSNYKPSPSDSDTWTYAVESGHATVTAYTGSKTEITIPSTLGGYPVTVIGREVFRENHTLTSVTIPDSVTEINDLAFFSCDNLTNIMLPSSLLIIGDQAFAHCSGLTGITIPDSVVNIGSHAFTGCYGLTSVTIPASANSLGDGAFLGCSSLTQINVDAGNYNYCSADGVLFNRYKTTLLQYPQGKQGGYSIPSTVAVIAEHAFEGCTGLTSITIPDSVTVIGGDAFLSCIGLTSVAIPDSVTVIGEAAFSCCDGLTSVTIPDSVVSIGGGTFMHCYGLTSVTIPDSVTKLEDALFEFCNHLSSVTFSNSVTHIGRFVFDSTCSSLTDVYYGGTEAEWAKIEIESDNEQLDKATIHYKGSATYTVSYNANGGTGAPPAQTKKEGVDLTLSSVVPTKTFTVTYDANGGSVSPAGKTLSCKFKGWNRKADGSGITYAPGDSYTGNNDITFYALWTNPTVGELPTPTRSGYAFDGWFIDASGGVKVTASTVISKNQTLNAHWTQVQTYTVSYDANGGTGAPSAQTKEAGAALTLSSTAPKKSFTLTYDANGGSVSSSGKSVSCTFKSWNTAKGGGGTSYAAGASYTADADVTLYAQWTNPAAGELATPTRSGYTFAGWYTAATGGTQVTASTTVGKNQTLYAHWTQVKTYTVSYDANGGTGTPSAQTKEAGAALTLSTVTPAKSFMLQYNANGGSVSPASKSVSCTFKSWNTAKDGSGTSYASGGKYTADADATLYAQWTSPKAGELAVPTRSGYTFAGWYTAASGGTQVTASATVSKGQTLYAHWTAQEKQYNLGEETYSFSNYGDSDSPGGHCFGMSMTSAGYYNGLLDIGIIGGNADTPLHSFGNTATVRRPICYYQGVQSPSIRNPATVAGGCWYLHGWYNIASDWQEVVAFVRDHSYDGTGLLQIGFRKNFEGGHAINFLRYENVNGQDRIYAYDNNFPDQETYFYQDSSGKVWQTPAQTFSGAIDCIALRDCRIYFSLTGNFDATHVLYMAEGAAEVVGYTYSYMEGLISGEEYVMYEIPADQKKVTIVPLKDNADFIYMDTEYSFGAVEDDTRGELTFATMKEGAVTSEASFRIYTDTAAAPGSIASVNVTPSSSGKITLSWSASAGAKTYVLQRHERGSDKWTTLASNIKGTTYVDASGTAGRIYQYRVRGRDGDSFGPYKTSAEVACMSGSEPGSVGTPTVKPASGGKITVSWKAADGAATYILQRNERGSSTWTTLGSNIKETKYTDTSAKLGKVYRYRVRSRNVSVFGPFKVSVEVASMKGSAPGAVGTPAVEAAKKKITVSWTAAEGAATYILQRKERGSDAWTTLNSNIRETSYVDTTGTVGKVYQYRVRSRNVSTYGPFKASTEAGFMSGSTPGDIKTVTVKAASGKITVTWTASSGAAGYIVQRKVKGSSAWETLSTYVTELKYVDKTAKAGTTYQYRIRPRNGSIYGSFKAGAEVTAQ